MLGMVLRPVGHQPAAVYWRRRLLLLLIMIVVVVVLVRACSGGSGAGRSDARSHHPSAGHTPTAQAAGPCAAADLSAAVTAQPTSAAAGTPVRFTGVVSNTSAVACLLQVTPSQLVWNVRDGSTKVWNCAPSYSTQQSLPPNGSLRLHITWQGKVSNPPKCHGTTPASAGSYAVRMRLGKTKSPSAHFTLTAATGASQG